MAILHDHVKGRVNRVGVGALMVLTKEEEKEIVLSVQVLQEIGFALVKELVGMVINNYLADLPGKPFCKWSSREKLMIIAMAIRTDCTKVTATSKPQSLISYTRCLGSVVQMSRKSFPSNRFKCITC